MTDVVLLFNGKPVKVPENYVAIMQKFKDSGGNPLTFSDIAKYGPDGEFHKKRVALEI